MRIKAVLEGRGFRPSFSVKSHLQSINKFLHGAGLIKSAVFGMVFLVGFILNNGMVAKIKFSPPSH